MAVQTILTDFYRVGVYICPVVVNSPLITVITKGKVGFQLGLDTGGTYTDAVLVNDDLDVLSSAKSLTTHQDLISGLRNAVERVVTHEQSANIQLVSISTTLATNALVEGRGRAVALVLIGFTPAQMNRAGLTDALAGDPHVFVKGGHKATGQAVCALDISALEQFIVGVDRQVDAYAVSSVFAVRNPAHENEARALISQVTGKPVTCGHHLSSGLDAPRRALTALLNARLIPMIGALLAAARALLIERNINAPLMVVKGDGSLISDEMASRYPVETILSGPAASIVGAQFLCQEPQLLVSDMGGTTTDVALIRDGQPRLDPDGATVGGWRTMVRAVDVRTYGLGGDSAIRFDRGRRKFTVGPQRVVPLSLLTQQHPELLEVMQAQLAMPYSITHSAQFVMTHGTPVVDLSVQQRELYERISEGPIAIQTLFSDQTLERALLKLEQRGIVLRAGFTPSDASHLTGAQTSWQVSGAELGAQLLMRYSADNLGQHFATSSAFAQHIVSLVARNTAMVLMDAVGAADSGGKAFNDSQKALLQQSLEPYEQQSLMSLCATLHIPVAALGAPAASYYGHSAKLLGTTHISPEHASVANALGAVVGTVRQEQVIIITPGGGKQVSVLFPDGPESFDTLEQGADAALTKSEQLARDKASLAGASDVTVTHERHDTIVHEGDQHIFFESRIVATAVGRPARMQ